MTLTEQDKELFRLASLIGCEPQDEERHRQQLADYITADRKRVALEARLDELNSVEEDPWGVQHIPKPRKYRNGYTVGVLSIEERIAQLQAELNETSDE